jgi:hypothetical protein
LRILGRKGRSEEEERLGKKGRIRKNRRRGEYSIRYNSICIIYNSIIYNNSICIIIVYNSIIYNI